MIGPQGPERSPFGQTRVFRARKDFLGVEKATRVVVRSRGEMFSCRRPRKSADLLAMNTDLCKKGHRSMPTMYTNFHVIDPLNSVVIHIAKLVASQKLFSSDCYAESSRRTSGRHWLEGKTSNSARLLGLKASTFVEQTPQTDMSAVASNSKDTVTAIGGRERQ